MTLNSQPSTPITALTYPARPVNGGPLEKALPKTGEWHYEPKYNGWRALVHVPTRTIWNRKGEKLSIANDFKEALDLLCPALDCMCQWIDCEALERRHGIGRGTLIVLDMIPDAVDNKFTYKERRAWLTPHLVPMLFPHDKPKDNTIYQSFTLCNDSTLALEFYQHLKVNNANLGCEFYEGLVAKRADSLYPIQLRSPDTEFPFWVKHRWAF